MELTWIGHACFRLRSGNSAVLMDPFSEALGLKIPPQQSQANVVTTSSSAQHHHAVEVATGETKRIVITGPGEYEAAGVRLKAIRTSRHVDEEGDDPWNTVYVVDSEGMAVCHLGNPDRLLTAREIEELGSPHVLLLPVGSREGLSPADAVEMVSAISPRIVVPMLYAHPGSKADLREVGPFLQELGTKQPETLPKLTVTRATLPEETQITLLQPAATML